MVDIAIETADFADGVLTIKGAGFTKTTTVFYFDDEEEAQPFELVSDTEVTITLPEGESPPVTVAGSKAGVDTEDIYVGTKSETEPEQSGSSQPSQANVTPGDVSEDDQTADVSPRELATAANAGADFKRLQEESAMSAEANAPDRSPLAEGEHLPGKDFRTKVENTAAGDLNMDPRQPYPTGNPPDPREAFHRMHGYYPEDKPSQTGPGVA